MWRRDGWKLHHATQLQCCIKVARLLLQDNCNVVIIGYKVNQYEIDLLQTIILVYSLTETFLPAAPS